MEICADDWQTYSLKQVRSRVITLLTASDTTQTAINVPVPLADNLRPPTGKPSSQSCSKCPGFRYITNEEFREHCKSEWHVTNLRRDADSHLTFEEWYLGESDSETSGSSEESEVDESVRLKSKLILHSIPFTIVPSGGMAFSSVILEPRVMVHASFVVVLLLRSGRFAGAVWDSAGHVVAHVCFKRYTVRRKNGGGQSKNDNSRGSPAHSAGAQIRRSQEKILSEEVYEQICTKWKHYLDKPTSVVFAYASKGQVADLFVGPLEKGKAMCHIYPVPLSVRDPTFAEVCRVHEVLTKVAFPRDTNS